MKISDIKALDNAGLDKALHEARAQLVEKRRSLRSGELQNPRSITELRKRVAKLLTVMKEKKEKEA